MKFIQSPIFWLALLLFIAIGVLVARRVAWRDKRPAASGDDGPRELVFQDFVRNPELLGDPAEEKRQLELATKTAQSWSDDQVKVAVQRFVFGVSSQKSDWTEVQVLSLGTRPHPTLLEILRDPALREKLVRPTRVNLLPEAPFNRICHLLENSPPTDAVPLLAPFLGESSSEIRKDAAIILGTIGAESVIEPIRLAFSDSDEYVRSYALMGLGRAIDSNRLSAECRRELFGDIEQLISNGKNGSHAPRLLFRFDRDRATNFFFSDSQFSSNSESLHDILAALNEHRVIVPRTRLLSLVAGLGHNDLEYPQTYMLGEALHALGRHKLAEDRPTLDRFMLHREKIVAEGAAEGMMATHGLEDAWQGIWKVIEERGLEALTEPQRRYHAVLNFDAEVNNGGLTQYFFNSSGNEWRAASAGLEAIGSKERLSVLRESANKFGPGGPSEDRTVRMAQLSRLSRAQPAVFEGLDDRYYKSTENVTALAKRYAVRHAEAFR